VDDGNFWIIAACAPILCGSPLCEFNNSFSSGKSSLDLANTAA
jgi:hypothetical protein